VQPESCGHLNSQNTPGLYRSDTPAWFPYLQFFPSRPVSKMLRYFRDEIEPAHLLMLRTSFIYSAWAHISGMAVVVGLSRSICISDWSGSSHSFDNR
jgi:hypothetical protein